MTDSKDSKDNKQDKTNLQTKTNDSKPTESDQMKKLFDNMYEFVIQTYSGVLISYIRLIKEEDSKHINDTELLIILNVLLKKYLNMCYHSYYKNNDGYVINNFNNIINVGLIKNVTCLIYWIDKITYTLFNISSKIIIDVIESVNDIDICRDRFRKIASVGYKKIYSSLANFKGCSDNCHNEEYDGEDIFIFSS